ncbi:MAG TPA: efflux RND transporter periplasmic adaptor subunit [Planctomycetota bacterium]|jgi:membrane fusion protein (multidrug efflux system)|nr:efflux RND transporter periplasmic adaptor subunit [Planctomycetota bacterium]
MNNLSRTPAMLFRTRSTKLARFAQRLTGSLGVLACANLSFLSAQDAPPMPPGPSQAAPATVPVETATIARGTLRQSFPVIGDFHAHLTSSLGAQVSGRVAEVKVDTGDHVKAGDTVVTLDPTFFNLEIAQQEAALKAAAQRVATQEKMLATAKLDIALAETGLADAKLQLDRMKNLWEKPAGQEPSIPRKQYDDATTRVKQSEIAVAAAQARYAEAGARITELTLAEAPIEAALAYAKQRLAETEVKAPFNAVVTRRLVAPGDSVTSAPATTLLELQDLDHLDLEFNVPQGFQSTVGEKTVVYYSVGGLPGTFSGPIERILPLGDEATRTYRCRVRVENTAGRFRPGLLVQVKLTQQEKVDVVIAPAAALKATSSGWQALLQKNGAFVPQPVEVGLRSENQVEIVKGLAPGDVVQLARER